MMNNISGTSLEKPGRKYCFIFVCQYGYLEIQSVLLAASLRRFLKCNYELVAVIPTYNDVLPLPEDLTLDLLTSMGVKLIFITNDLLSEYPPAKHYLMTNKFYCLKVQIESDKIIYLDADILLMKDFYDEDRFSFEFNAKKVSYPGALPTAGQWEEIYKAVGVEMPKLRMRVESGRNGTPPVYVPPYFNAGIVAINSNLAPQFSKYWMDCFNVLEKRSDIIKNKFFQEQISLALAVQKMGLVYEIMNEEIGEYFYHYHNAKYAIGSAISNKLIKSFMTEYPKTELLIKRYPEWRDVLFPRPVMIAKANLMTVKNRAYSYFKNSRQ